MAKTFRLATTQVHFGWSDAGHKVNPHSEQFDPAAVGAHIESNIRTQLALFEEAGRNHADIVVGCEDMQRLGHFGGNLDNPKPFYDLVETIPGPTSRRIGAIAKKHRMHIVACYPEKNGRKYHNTGVLFGRDGRIIGKYRKVQLPGNETWAYTPGDEYPVFRTDLGNVGISICYDMMFPEPTRCLALNGADLIAHPTMGYGWTEKAGEATIVSRAIDNGVTIIVSCSKRSQVVNFWGDILCDAGRRQNVVAFADWDPRAKMEQPANHYGVVQTGIADVRERWTKERLAKTFEVIASPNPPLLARYSKKMPPRTLAEKRKAYEATRDEARRVARGEAPKLTWG